MPASRKNLSECLVYHAQVDRSDINQAKNYYGTCEKNSKERYNNHTASFRNKITETSTELSRYIWELKNGSVNYDLKWSIACKAHSYTGGTRECGLCLTEKLAIMKADPKSLHNTREEFVSKCRHMNKFTLRVFQKKPLIKYIGSLSLRDL